MDEVVNIKSDKNLDWFIIILINIFYSDKSKNLLRNKKKGDEIYDIIKNFSKLKDKLPVEILLIKFLRMTGDIEINKMMIIRKYFGFSIRYIINLYELFGVNIMNLFNIDGNYYININKYYKYYYNYYKGTIDINKTWKFEIGNKIDNYYTPELFLVHFNIEKKDDIIIREIINKFDDKFIFDEYNDFIHFNKHIYKLDTIVYKDDNDNYLILFKMNKIKYLYNYFNKEIKIFDWNSKLYMFKCKKILMTYIIK